MAPGRASAKGYGRLARITAQYFDYFSLLGYSRASDDKFECRVFEP